jgi:hypothetical protein
MTERHLTEAEKRTMDRALRLSLRIIDPKPQSIDVCQLQQRRDDKAWLLRDLRERRREAAARIPRKSGFIQQIAIEGEDRFERLIALVREIPA